MKKLPDTGVLVNADAIGLDVHRELIVFCRLDRHGHEVATGEFEATKRGLTAFLAEHVGRRRSHLTLEASGSFLWAYELLVTEIGLDRIHVATSRDIAAIARSTAKNDKNDAWWLAWLTQQGRLPQTRVPEKKYLELRIATRERVRAVQRRTKAMVALRAFLAAMGEVVPTVSLATLSAAEFLDAVLARTPKIRAIAIRRCRARIAQCEEEIAEWEDVIAAATKKMADTQIIVREIPGVGPVLSATIAAELADPRRFGSAKAVGRYTGLTPSDRSSGGKTIHGAITREGSPFLRWALVQAVMHCLRSKKGPGLVIGDWVRAAERRMGHKGKARVAGARKLSEAIWRLFQDPKSFDVTMPFRSRALEPA